MKNGLECSATLFTFEGQLCVWIRRETRSKETFGAMTQGEISFMDAVRGRYGAPNDMETCDTETLLVGNVNRARNKKWELVGMEKTREKQANHAKLLHIVLRGMGVTVCEKTDGELGAAALHRLEELDLSENPRLSMQEVGKVVRHLPALLVLQLSHNPSLLASATTLPKASLLHSEKLRKLVLHNVGFRSFMQLRTLVDLPLLEELHLDGNGIERLQLFDDLNAIEDNVEYNPSMENNLHSWFHTVKTLSLAQNKLASWGRESGLSDVLSIAFPHLTALFLTGNLMPDLSIENSTIDSACFAHEYAYLRPLTLLCVKDNLTLSDPRSFDALRELCPNLLTFRVSYGGMFLNWNETLGRMYVIASLPTITKLNRGEVRKKERIDSEIFYVQRGLAYRIQEQERVKEADKDEELGPSFLHYPLLDILQEKYKDVIMAIHREGETASSDGIACMMLHLTIRCDGFADAKKMLPSSLTVGKLKALVRAIFGVAPSDQELFCFTGDSAVVGIGVPLDNEMRSLAFYGVCDGMVVHVIDSSLRK